MGSARISSRGMIYFNFLEQNNQTLSAKMNFFTSNSKIVRKMKLKSLLMEDFSYFRRPVLFYNIHANIRFLKSRVNQN